MYVGKKIEKFIGHNSFTLLKSRIKYFFIQLKVHKDFLGKDKNLVTMKDEDRNDTNEIITYTIGLNIFDNL